MKEIDELTRIRLEHMAGSHPKSLAGCPVCRHADNVARIWRDRRSATSAKRRAITAT